MTKLLFIFICGLPIVSPAQNHYWQQEVNNRIDVSLNDKEHSLDGFIKIQYINHSPDTLSYIWFHLFPNAFKSDRTAFSEQLLQNGRTDFYFSDKDQRGYINRLDFRINNQEAKIQDHPQYIDIVKVILPKPLPPEGAIEITTPFHVKLPFNFSRGGYVGQSYQITQWYPKPAVYDSKGWHEMPYFDQGNDYSEFGNFDVRITVPAKYKVAATGELLHEEELNWQQGEKGESSLIGKEQWNKQTKTLQYKQNNIDDFVWFADKRFIVTHDTLQIRPGKTIDIFSFYLPKTNSPWQKSNLYIKEALKFRSTQVGEYPFHTFCAVEAKTTHNGEMAYPTIACISHASSGKELDLALEHLIGHNWFSGVIANNEREEPWMNEGINTFYDQLYNNVQYGTQDRPGIIKVNWMQKKMPDDIMHSMLLTVEAIKKDQQIETSSENFSNFNYRLIAYLKTSDWMKMLSDNLGTENFNGYMQSYFQQWKFKHPYPEDFKNTMEVASNKKLDSVFALLKTKGSLREYNFRRKIRPTFLFNLNEKNNYNYLSFAPVAGYNFYDKLMIGAAVHNFNLPPNRLQFIFSTLYATNSKQLNAIGNFSYTWYPDKVFQNIKMGFGIAKFSSLSGTDSNNKAIFGGFYKITPYLLFTLKNEDARSTLEKWIDFRTYFIGEKNFNYLFYARDSSYHPVTQKYSTRYLNQLTFNAEDFRVLYPYQVQLQMQQSNEWFRLNFTSNYFFNYSNGGGMHVRFFAAKFGYLGQKTISKAFETYSYQPKLTASIGSDDYTYSNYFIGRNEFNGFASQQIMMKDGGLKLRTDIFQDLQGRSDNWVAAFNFNSTLPASVLPRQIPLKVFFDLGTYADAWGNNPPTSKLLYVGGVELSLLRNLIHIYAPLIYSSDFSNQLKTLSSENTFLKKISFSIDVQNINLRRIFHNVPF